MRHNTTLTLHAIAKSYKKIPIIQDISLQVYSGEIVGLIGPNGAGKTTIFHSIIGLITPDSGIILLGDCPVTRLPMHRRAQLGISYLPQEASIFRRMTVRDNILAILEMQGLSRQAQHQQLALLLEEFQLTALQNVPGRVLSGGERRRVELARLLATSPRFVLLDEPFAGIDPLMVRELQTAMFALKQRNLGVLITDHRVRELFDIVDRAYIIHRGRLLHHGTPQELVENQEAKQIYLGENFSLFSDPHKMF